MGMVFAGLLLGVPLIVAIMDLSRTRATNAQPRLTPSRYEMLADSHSLVTRPDSPSESSVPVSDGLGHSVPRRPSEVWAYVGRQLSITT
jgi:hypothetical protein